MNCFLHIGWVNLPAYSITNRQSVRQTLGIRLTTFLKVLFERRAAIMPL